MVHIFCFSMNEGAVNMLWLLCMVSFCSLGLAADVHHIDISRSMGRTFDGIGGVSGGGVSIDPVII